MTSRRTRAAKRPQRGAAVLGVALVLLLGLSLTAFYANRSFIFEQRASANQFRSTAAFDLAEAGVEWATARLNDELLIDATPSCTNASQNLTSASTFRTRYLVPTARSGNTPAGFYPPANARAACSLASTGVLSCSCPAPGAALEFANAEDPRFVVQFNPVTQPTTPPVHDPSTIEIVAKGCSSDDTNCGGSGTADARQAVRVLVKLVPVFDTAPAAALTAGNAVATGSDLTVVNTDLPSHGVTINAGTDVTHGSGLPVQTVPGASARESILDNDPSLAALANADGSGDLFFQSLFGKTMQAFKAEAKVIGTGSPSPDGSTTCDDAPSCGAVVGAWSMRGVQRFWVEPDVQLTGAGAQAPATLGTPQRPIYLAASNKLDLESSLTVYGLLYAAAVSGSWDYNSSGTATVVGAMVTRGSFAKGSGSLNVVYDAKVFGLDGASPAGTLVRVPGSWRDKSSAYTDQ